MKLYDFFSKLREYTEYVRLARKNAALSRPMIYSDVVDVSDGGTNEGVINITSEGAFISEYLSISFDFDQSDLPQVSVKITDTSNGEKALTNGYVPLELISSVGKTGNQLLNLYPFEQFFKENANIRFEFKNDGDEQSVVKYAIIGRQTRDRE